MPKLKNKTKKYDGFLDLVEGVSEELFTVTAWDEARKKDETSGGTHELDMLTAVYQTAFLRNPKLFKGIKWINAEDGTPAWVRPGEQWEYSPS